jgi:hypothetical protein
LLPDPKAVAYKTKQYLKEDRIVTAIKIETGRYDISYIYEIP